MRVLVACEFSGMVRNAFAARGHDAWSCDLQPSEDNSPQHVIGYAEDILHDEWDLLIAHPPCTRLCHSGVRWLAELDLWDDMRVAAELFATFLHAPVPRRCIENPVMHWYAKDAIRDYWEWDQIIHPWQYGHPEFKRTCLWLTNLPPLRPTKVLDAADERIRNMPDSLSRSRERSRTYSGIAAAMADQWGSLSA